MKSTDSKSILVVDDQQDVREALRLMLESDGFQIKLAASPDQALEQMRQELPSLVLFDMNYTRDTTSGQEGLDLLHEMRAHYADDDIPFIAMTAWGSIDLAVEAVKRGASDFIEKPWENQRLLNVIRSQLQRSSATREAERLGQLNRIQREDNQTQAVIAESESMQKLLAIARQVAQSDASILITGDNGAGKSLIAEQIHRWSPLADAVFVSVNMGSIPEALFEAEMFGHAKGAFTDAHEARAGRFELADQGTLFLDEVGNLPMAQQAKLLRVLETGQFERVGETRTRKVRVRVIAATNADLPAMVERGEFRRDLYFRLNTIELVIPPLSERPDDIMPLARFFLQRHARRYKRDLVFSPAAETLLMQHDWPGNVRELSHAIERAVLLCNEDAIQPEHLMLRPGFTDAKQTNQIQPLEQIERAAIQQALRRFDGDVNQAAAALGLSRSALYRRLEKFKLDTQAQT